MRLAEHVRGRRRLSVERGLRPGAGRRSSARSALLATSTLTATLATAALTLALAPAPPAQATATGATAAGQLFASGENEYGQLGDGTSESRASFAANPLLPPSVIEASPSYYASLVLLADGAVEGSGYDGYGELGLGEKTAPKDEPVAVQGISDATAVSEGGGVRAGSGVSEGGGFSLALLSNGTVESWGYDAEGELGNGRSITGALGECMCTTTPAPVLDVGGVGGRLEGVVAISAGSDFAAALLADGHVVTWGEGEQGQLGNGKTENSAVPVEVVSVGGSGVVSGSGTLEGVVAISAGSNGVVALLSNGHVVTWGGGEQGQLGDGESKNSAVPVEVSGIEGNGELEHVAAVSGGADFDVALLASGEVLAWGYNDRGELGDDSTAESNVPVHVLGVGGAGALTGITSVSADAYSTLATTSSHDLVGWGYNGHGELGTSEPTGSAPVDIPSVSGVFSLGHGDENRDSLVIEGAYAALSASALDFGAVTAGETSATQSVVLTDEGPAPLTVSGATLSGSGEFAVKADDGCSGATLTPGGTCAVTLTFAPTVAGTASGSLSFAGSAANALPSVSLSGVGAAPSTSSSQTGGSQRSGGGDGGKKNGPRRKPMIAIDTRKIPIINAGLEVKLTCRRVACDGVARFVKRIAVKTKSKGKTRVKHERLTLASGSYSLPAGGTSVVSFELTGKGDAYLARYETKLVSATLTLTLAGGKRATRAVKLG